MSILGSLLSWPCPLFPAFALVRKSVCAFYLEPYVLQRPQPAGLRPAKLVKNRTKSPELQTQDNVRRSLLVIVWIILYPRSRHLIVRFPVHSSKNLLLFYPAPFLHHLWWKHSCHPKFRKTGS